VSRRSGLGRGLGALIPSELRHGPTSELRDLPISSIEPNRFQPREGFDEDNLIALSESIREVGVLQPLLVRPLDGEDERFELIAGERRLRAAKRAGLASVPAIVRAVDDMASLEQALVENLHREDLSALEEAAAYQQLMEDFALTQEEVARRVGRSRSAVANTLRLFQLTPSIQRMLSERRLSAGHARALLGTPDRAFQEAMAKRICAEGLSVRQTEETIRRRGELAAKLRADPEEDERPEGASAGQSSGAASPPDTQPPPDATQRRSESASFGERPVGAPHSTGAVTRSGGGRVMGPPADAPPAGLLELRELLADYLDTTVAITTGTSKGRITIDFADLEDLERIYRLIAAPPPSG
jgi:ParB family chromosome partitioning protein